MNLEINGGRFVITATDLSPEDAAALVLALTVNGQGALEAAPSLLELAPAPEASGPPAHGEFDFPLPGRVYGRLTDAAKARFPVRQRKKVGPGERVIVGLEGNQAVDLYRALGDLAASLDKNARTSVYRTRVELGKVLDDYFHIAL